MNCDHRRCTRSVNTILSFYRASEVHGMYINLDLYRAFISRYARHILLVLRRLPCIGHRHARHLLSCSRVISTVMHGIYFEICLPCNCRHARHILLSQLTVHLPFTRRYARHVHSYLAIPCIVSYRCARHLLRSTTSSTSTTSSSSVGGITRNIHLLWMSTL